MKITLERKTAKDGKEYWIVEHSDTHVKLLHDTFADAIEYLDVYLGIIEAK